jgi:Alpha/beta hydrolase
VTRVVLVAGIVLASGTTGPVGVEAAPSDRVPLTPVHWNPGRLEERYADSRRRLAEAAAQARRAGDVERASRLTALGRTDRQILRLSLDGDGQAVEVLGDLLTARWVAVLVPGSDSNLDTFDRLGTAYASVGGAARALLAELRHSAPRERIAVVAWLGYPAPRTKSAAVLTPASAAAGGPALANLLTEVHQANASASTALVCHSYGSVVCAQALHRLDPATPEAMTAAVFIGSPGVSFPSARDIGTSVPVWAGRGSTDWIARVPHLRFQLFGVPLGFGTDPMSAEFGARRFAAGAGGHSDYFVPGGVALHAIALIILRGQS